MLCFQLLWLVQDFEEKGKSIFYGKIRIFSFVTMQTAERRSKNIYAETLELKVATSIKREYIKSCLVDKVISAIHEKWSMKYRRKPIFIQQDNARTHI